MGRCSRRAFALGLLLPPSVLSALAAFAEGRRRLYIQPLGDGIGREDVGFVTRSLEAFYDFEVSALPAVELPASAFYAPRKRYRAERLLATLGGRLPADGYRILGLTAVDISTTKGAVKDWGVLGLATIDGSACVLSSFRCRRGSRGPAHTLERLGKVAVHEIGHTLGLEHCPARGCLMEDGRGTVTTVDREYDLCGQTRQQLLRAGHVLARGGEPPPWPEPPDGG